MSISDVWTPGLIGKETIEIPEIWMLTDLSRVHGLRLVCALSLLPRLRM